MSIAFRTTSTGRLDPTFHGVRPASLHRYRNGQLPLVLSVFFGSLNVVYSALRLSTRAFQVADLVYAGDSARNKEKTHPRSSSTTHPIALSCNQTTNQRSYSRLADAPIYHYTQYFVDTIQVLRSEEVI